MRRRSALLTATLAACLAGATASMHAAGQTATATDGTPEQRAIAAILRDSNRRIPGATHPLPLAASWNTGLKPLGFTPAWQIEQIRRGRYLLPWFVLAAPPPGPERVGYSSVFDTLYYGSAIGYLAQHRLPLTFEAEPWESLLPAKGRPLPLAFTVRSRRAVV